LAIDGIDDLVQELYTLDSIVRTRLIMGTIQQMSQFPVEDVGDESAFARTRDTSNHDEFP